MKHLTYIILSLAIITFGCTERYDVALTGTYTRLIVDGNITTDTTAHLIRLAKSADYFTNMPLDPITNAQVYISDGSNTFILHEDPAKPGDYYTDPNVYGIQGRTYTLLINNVDINSDNTFEAYTATCKMNPSSRLDSMQVDLIHKFYRDNYQIAIYGHDPAETRDIYMYKVKINGKLITDTITEARFADDEFFNGSDVKYQPVYYLTPTKTDEELKEGDTITLEQYGVTKDYFDFFNDVLNESHGADPFGGQPANIYTNVEDKDLSYGFFGAFSVTRIYYIIKKEDLALKTKKN
jgi:hypothetical protein